MTHRRTLFGSLAPLLLLSATGATSQCSISTDSGTGTFELRIRGTVLFLETGSGCWRLDADDGRRYELIPDQVPAALLRNGARVTVMGREVERSKTGCQVGQPLAVDRLVSLEPAPASVGS
jgi:hypothetical protein